MLFTVASQAALTLGRVVGQVISIVIQVIMLAGIAMVVWKERRSGPSTLRISFRLDHDVLFDGLHDPWFGAGRHRIDPLCCAWDVRTVAYMFSNMLIVDRKFTPWEALEASRRVVTRNWWGVAGLTGVMMGLMVSGAAAGVLVLWTAARCRSERILSGCKFKRSPLRSRRKHGRCEHGTNDWNREWGHARAGIRNSDCRVHVLGIAYADIFGLSATGDEGSEPVAEKMRIVVS